MDAQFAAELHRAMEEGSSGDEDGGDESEPGDDDKSDEDDDEGEDEDENEDEDEDEEGDEVGNGLGGADADAATTAATYTNGSGAPDDGALDLHGSLQALRRQITENPTWRQAFVLDNNVTQLLSALTDAAESDEAAAFVQVKDQLIAILNGGQ